MHIIFVSDTMKYYDNYCNYAVICVYGRRLCELVTYCPRMCIMKHLSRLYFATECMTSDKFSCEKNVYLRRGNGRVTELLYTFIRNEL